MKKIALITWASSGLGVDFAHQLVSYGYHCILVARSKDKLLAVKKDIERKWWSAEVIAGDLSDHTFCFDLMKQVAQKPLSLLINNAGFGDHGDFEILDTDHQLNMIDLNCRTLTYLMQETGRQMIQHKTSWYILNVASTAAFQPGPTMATYFATKAFVISLSEAVRYEWKHKHIHVSTLCPGPTKTEFFKNSSNNLHSRMLDNMMESSEVVRSWLEGLFDRKSIIIPWFTNKFLYYVTKFIPNDIIMSVIKKGMN